MKRSVGCVVAGVFALQLLPGGAWAAGCANRADASALKVAALQQELMVAALSCHEIARYNDFVISHQPELIASDANLKAFFVRTGGGRRGEAGYHSYKTELANSASLSSLRDDAFCDRAAAEFDAASDRGSLSSFVGARAWSAADVYPVCPGVTAPELLTASIAAPRRGEARFRRHVEASETGALGGDSDSPDDDGFYASRPHHRVEDRR